MLWNKNRHVYRQEGNVWLVEVRIERLEELFNNLDPSPFWQRDLDDKAAAYILDSVQELPRNARVRIVIHLAPGRQVHSEEMLASTMCSYFLYRARVNRQRLHKELQRGRISLLVGLSFLVSCFLLSRLIGDLDTVGSEILKEGLLIMGWVAMWRPIEIFLYEWWPHLGRARLYERVARLPVEVRGGQPAT